MQAGGKCGKKRSKEEMNRRHGRGFPEGSRLWRRHLRKANFFSGHIPENSRKTAENGKKIRRENFCGPAGPAPSSCLESPMKKFLLRCECAADMAVGTGQAGGRATCPGCGRSVEVPKLRELERLRELVPDTVAARPRWSPAHAVALLGAVVAIVAWTAAMIMTGSTPRGAVDLDAFRAAVNAASEAQVYAAWKRGTYESVERSPTRDEEKLLQVSRFAGGISRTLQIIGGLGAVTALVGGAAAVAGGASGTPVASSRSGPSVPDSAAR
jgi:hypothetical protein